METKSVGTYLRYSTDKQDMAAQQAQIESFVKYYGENNEVLQVTQYADEGVSGVQSNRPQMKKLLQDVRDKKINVVVVTKLDRLARSVEGLKTVVTFLEDHECDLIVIKDNIDTKTPGGRMFFHILSAFIEFERETIIERMQAGRKHAELKGSKSGKPCHRPKKELDMDKLSDLHKQGMSLNKMAKHMGVTRVTIKKRIEELLSSDL